MHGSPALSTSYDVIILGAGIIGTACALECARDGMRVAVVDAGEVGGGATAAGMGHIVVMDDSPAQLALTRYSQILWQDLAPELPSAAEYETPGTIWIAADEEEMKEATRKCVLYQHHNIPAEILDAQSLCEAEPRLNPALAGGLLVPQDAILNASRAARHLLDRAIWGDAVLLRKTAVKIGNNRVQFSDGTTFSSARIVNAAGADAAELTPELPIRRRKGHLVLTDRYPKFVRHQLVELSYLKGAGSIAPESIAFNVQPRKTGQMLIGSSRQYDAEGPDVEQPVLDRMMERARSYLPDLDQLTTVRAWTGFRAATPDKLPLIGPSWSDPTVFLATGHEGLGITTALATARLLADHIAGRSSEIPREPYFPSRLQLDTMVDRGHS
ncbi:MAG TPA: FAD-dependent oxidoreductase [Acidobacteriaceae bacterium]|nr:FAD-dependent oxidoreductase [Acidobacteriaceae bacterium]